ncbi:MULTISPECIES: hypothetical protein [unclassified Corynebacterium]|uniref:hypothetical protein n=1 Tax=unclassified Corynebacterium TaxID=2624378 RepID=UPI00163DCB77|nr:MULTISPECIES: hypothetical protein [unclassified Corynebacterium]
MRKITLILSALITALTAVSFWYYAQSSSTQPSDTHPESSETTTVTTPMRGV